MPLLSCETRAIQLDGVDAILQANADESLASVTVLGTPDNALRAQALTDIQRTFGNARVDTRRTVRPGKWGVPQLTDLCGHLVYPSPSP